MNPFKQVARKFEIDMSQLSREELEMTLECAYNVQRNLHHQIFKKSKAKLIGNLEALNEIIACYESAFVNTLAVKV